MDLALFATMAFSLFLIVDPVGCLPLFITITKDNTRQERRQMVLRASVVAFIVLAFFALVGNPLMGYFHISIPAMRIAGGILLFTIGIEMLFGRITKTEATDKEVAEAIVKRDVSITPLAIPLLAGPGAITAVMLYTGQAQGFGGTTTVIAAILLVAVVSWLLLSLSEALVKVLGNIGITVIARVMGLLLVFMSVQLVIDGMANLGLIKAVL
jgi:multiple antibiotic resistance protein